MEKITTAENLAEDLYGCMHSAVLDYGDYTIAVWDHCYKGSIAEVYELVETPDETGLGRCECRISLIERKEEFEDAGHAMAWAELDSYIEFEKRLLRRSFFVAIFTRR